jgi:hypothetical protein
MKPVFHALTPLALAALLGACQTTTTDATGAPRLIAQPKDTAIVNRGPLVDAMAALAVDPDGCQAWLIDDGTEGYSTRRRDPRSGLPVCSPQFQPGYVYGEYQTNRFPDILP